MVNNSTRYGENPDGTLREGVIYLDPADGNVKSVQPGETVRVVHGDPFADVPTETEFLRD